MNFCDHQHQDDLTALAIEVEEAVGRRPAAIAPSPERIA